MIIFVGTFIVFASVVGGFMMAGGHVGALIHVSEFVVIGGAAGGALVIMSPKKVLVDLGQQVEPGQLLMEIASNEIAEAKSSYLKSLDQERLKEKIYQREKELVERNVSAKQDFQQAEMEYLVAKNEVITARQRLVNYGLTDQDIESVVQTRSPTTMLKIYAPISGCLVERHAVRGEAIQAGESLLQIVDLSSLWLRLSLPESEIGRIREGDQVRVFFDSLASVEVTGTISWISPRIHPETRTLFARADIPNPEGLLKAGLYGRARMLLPIAGDRLIIPSEAVQQLDDKEVVFVKEEADLFEMRSVLLGNREKNRTEILHGISPEEEIAVSRTFALKSEFLKSQFGAGCTGD